MKKITCPGCGTAFDLAHDPSDGRPETLFIWYCESGGVYAITIICPVCHLEDEVM